MHKLKKSFTLVEVLIFVTIVSLVFITALAVATFALKTMIFNQHKIIATHYAEEGLEWLKVEKEADWNAFKTLDTSGGWGTVYCITTPDTAKIGPCDGSYFLGNPNIFSREVTLINRGNPVNQIDVTIKVYWPEGTYFGEVLLKSNLKILE